MDIMTWARSQWDRLTAAATAVAGAVVLIIGWRGVSGTAYVAEQVPYVISAGIGGLFLLGISTALWLSADLRDEWRKLDRIERAIRAADGLGAVEDGAAPDGRDRTVDHDRTVLLPPVGGAS
ncbi:hypothetical protein ACWCXB_31400 [Streptomyces sp. NPDC001514]